MATGMDRYELPIKISAIRGGFSVAVAISDQSVISRQISRADLVQLQEMIGELLGTPRREVPPTSIFE